MYDNLYELYVVKNLSLKEIANIKNKSISTISRNLKKQNIERRSISDALNSNKIDLTNDLLLQLYVKENKTLNEISKLLGYSGQYISVKLKSYNIEVKFDFNGKNNPMYGRSFYDVWLEKYGKEEADKRLRELKRKKSINNSGANNPMYGKPSPQGSGNGWSGWYKSIHFRSLLELSFLVNWVDRFNLKLESAEKKKYGIKYQFNGRERTYFADWIVNDKYLVEIKPKRLWSTPQNKAKFEAAKEYCQQNNLTFKVIEPIKISKKYFKKLFDNKKIKLYERYYKKFTST